MLHHSLHPSVWNFTWLLIFKIIFPTTNSLYAKKNIFKMVYGICDAAAFCGLH
jgi:hypothetical protein